MAIYGQRSINGSIEWLGVPAPFFDTGVDWTDNILVPSPRLGDGVMVGDWYWGTQPGFLIGADVPWRNVVPACLAYLPRSPPENVCATTRHIPDTFLQEHRLEQSQNVLYAHHIGGDERVNRSDDNWDDLWDEPADQELCVKFPLVVWVATFGLLLGSLFGSLLVTTNFSESLIASACLSESFIWSTCSAESFLNQVLTSTCYSELFISSTCLSEFLCAESLIVDRIVHPLKFSTISARTPEASCISNENFASFFCTFIATGYWNEVPHVMLLMLR